MADERRAQPVLTVMRCAVCAIPWDQPRRYALRTTGTASLSDATVLIVSNATAKPLRASVPAEAREAPTLAERADPRNAVGYVDHGVHSVLTQVRRTAVVRGTSAAAPPIPHIRMRGFPIRETRSGLARCSAAHIRTIHLQDHSRHAMITTRLFPIRPPRYADILH